MNIGAHHSEETKRRISLYQKGRKKSLITRQKMSAKQLGSGNSNWKGDKVGFAGIHAWIEMHKPKPEFCEECGIVPPYDLANISQEYKRDINDFEWLCRKCHMKKDKRIERLTVGKRDKHGYFI